MDTQELNDTLAKLHEELAQGLPLDDETRGRLQVLLSDVQSVLDRGASAAGTDTDEEEDSLGDRVQDAVSEFEAAHPQFSQLMGRIADGLSNLGI